jgi:hypothetical protein
MQEYPMRTQIVSVVALVLLSACGAWGSLGQNQDFQVGGRHLVEWSGGVGSAGGRNETSFNQDQEFHNTYGRVSGLQGARASLVQTGTATGDGPATIQNNAPVTGSQRQVADVTAGFVNTSTQRLVGDLSMVVVKPYGIGSAGATQDFTSSQTQVLNTPFGWASQSQTLRAFQSANIGTVMDVDPTVTNTLNVQLNQQHTINGQPVSVTSVHTP